MASDGKNDEFKDLIREYVKEVMNEFMGAAACPGYTLPMGMAMDPESLSTAPKIKGMWPKQKKKKKKRAVTEAASNKMFADDLLKAHPEYAEAVQQWFDAYEDTEIDYRSEDLFSFKLGFLAVESDSIADYAIWDPFEDRWIHKSHPLFQHILGLIKKH